MAWALDAKTKASSCTVDFEQKCHHASHRQFANWAYRAESPVYTYMLAQISGTGGR